jgi:hypothetical protein
MGQIDLRYTDGELVIVGPDGVILLDAQPPLESEIVPICAGLPDVEKFCRCGHAANKHRMVRHADETFPVEQCATYKCICGMFEPLRKQL